MIQIKNRYTNKVMLEVETLREADLNGADLDFSCWPLWCGSIGVKLDKKQKKQFIYHVLINLDPNDKEEVKLIKACKKFANDFHRVISEECYKIK